MRRRWGNADGERRDAEGGNKRKGRRVELSMTRKEEEGSFPRDCGRVFGLRAGEQSKVFIVVGWNARKQISLYYIGQMF
jgi:hypothetical protein